MKDRLEKVPLLRKLLEIFFYDLGNLNHCGMVGINSMVFLRKLDRFIQDLRPELDAI